MTYTPFTKHGVLRALAYELDPESDRLDRARARYEDLGEWLSTHAESAPYNVKVYPQGSAALGTTNQHPETGEFDIDLVLSVEVGKDDNGVSKKWLNDLVHRWLDAYTKERQQHGGELAPSKLESRSRAWTLRYESDRFHMDILPVVPDLNHEIEATQGEPSWLTDKGLFYWQPTNPKGFREWFYTLVGPERRTLVTASVDVEPPPAFDRHQTELQVAIRLLKRHRDEAFRDDTDGVAPPSVVITALAARAYEANLTVAPKGDLLGLLLFLADKMPHLLDFDSSHNLRVENPTCPSENYADRFADREDRVDALFRWFERLSDDFVEASRPSTAPGGFYSEMDHMFGSGLGGRVAKRLGAEAEKARRDGVLTSLGAGGMSVGGAGISHKKHEFYGDETP